MSLQEPLRDVETARIELKQATANAQGWCDGQRRVFDRDRMEPLADAGARLAAVLQKVHEQCNAAEHLLSTR